MRPDLLDKLIERFGVGFLIAPPMVAFASFFLLLSALFWRLTYFLLMSI